MYVEYVAELPVGVSTTVRLRFAMRDAARAPVSGLSGSLTIDRSRQQQPGLAVEDPPVNITRTQNELGTTGVYEVTLQSTDVSPGMTAFFISGAGAEDLVLIVYFRARESYGGGI